MSVIENFKPTMNLRWEKQPSEKHILKQAWQGDKGTVEWRPIPSVPKPDRRKKKLTELKP